MRRILVDAARRKRRSKHGGDLWRVDADEAAEAIARPSRTSSPWTTPWTSLRPRTDAADLVKLRYFAGLSLAEATEVLGLSPRTADRRWAYARAWLHQEMLRMSQGFQKNSK